jgi:hypothetical protein
MPVNGGTGSETDRFADLPDGRRIPFGAYFVLDEIHDFLLALGQLQHCANNSS